MPNDSEEVKKILAERGPCLIETLVEGAAEHAPPVVFKCYFDEELHCEWATFGSCLKSFMPGTEMHAIRTKGDSRKPR